MSVRSLVTTLIRGASKQSGTSAQQQALTKEAVVELIQKATTRHRGLRKGWEVKAASWVKKVHIDRGDVKVGTYSRGRFEVLPQLRPRYFVPADLDKFPLKPYVEVEAASAKTGSAGASAAAP
ncbi:hypothetical protein GPECTOR_44g30 [Gonium pectorale]|uniref:Uncharacterized protein n=1 Tax=Gonium pectorale TaxID=33097 RepID=A0A150G931_GONPE|nr:hypothetical protein GPECTOR_44g30 [Gonium pectorale]|eukprot:KXZ46352.1 hypothetical protein GPECTOR_44g30 [Gonium pectorale]